MNFDRDALTGYTLREDELKPILSSAIEYETSYVGHVKIAISAYTELLNNDFDPERFIVAGICKHRTLEKKEPILVDSNFIRGGYKSLNPPIDFAEKAYLFLKYIYSNGGRENHDFEFNSTIHFPLAYASPDEFDRILDHLDTEYYISIRKKLPFGGNKHYQYIGVKLTRAGKEEAEKALPKLPMFGLVSQEITTGDDEIDEKINHARQLFFDEPRFVSKLNSKKHLVPFTNGVFDLLTKEFRVSKKEDYILLTTDYNFDSEKNNPNVHLFLEQILC